MSVAKHDTHVCISLPFYALCVSHSCPFLFMLNLGHDLSPDVKIIRYKDVLEVATIQISSLLILVHSYELAAPKGT